MCSRAEKCQHMLIDLFFSVVLCQFKANLIFKSKFGSQGIL